MLDWLILGGIGLTVFLGTLLLFWLNDDIAAFKQDEKRADTSPWGDVIEFPPGFHSADVTEGAHQDHA